MSSALLITTLALAASGGDRFDFDARLALGAASRLDASAQSEVNFEFGALFRYRLADDEYGMVPTILPEFSYVAFGLDRYRDDLGVVGVGYGWSHGPIVLGFVPGAVFGTFRQENTSEPVQWGGGLRLMAIAEITHFIGVQAGYIGAYAGEAGFRHEVYANVSLNFLGLATMWILGKAG